MLHEYAAALSATRLPNRGRRLTNVRKILDTTHGADGPFGAGRVLVGYRANPRQRTLIKLIGHTAPAGCRVAIDITWLPESRGYFALRELGFQSDFGSGNHL
jgi:hypothetical protein